MRNLGLLMAALSLAALPAHAQAPTAANAPTETTTSKKVTTKKVCKRVADVNSLVAKKVCRVIAVDEAKAGGYAASGEGGGNR